MAWLGLSRPLLVLVPLTVGLAACDPEPVEPDDDTMSAEGATEGDGDTEPGDAEPGDDEPGDDEPADDSVGTAGQPGGGGTKEPKPVAAVACEDGNPYGGRECMLDSGAAGTHYCIVVDGEELLTPCTEAAAECEPGEGEDYGCMGAICYWDEAAESFAMYEWSEPDCITPLVLNFDDAPVTYEPALATAFDMSSDGSCVSTDWPTAPWLAMDRDGDGLIRSGAELFGSATKMHTGGLADHGFAALAELDDDRDGRITPKDAAFAELVLWQDVDDDRVGAFGELRPLAETGIVSIDLGFARRADCDGRGNCGFERAAFEYRAAGGEIASGEVVDVHLSCR